MREKTAVFASMNALSIQSDISQKQIKVTSNSITAICRFSLRQVHIHTARECTNCGPIYICFAIGTISGKKTFRVTHIILHSATHARPIQIFHFTFCRQFCPCERNIYTYKMYSRRLYTENIFTNWY